jgi:hypothetical protein
MCVYVYIYIIFIYLFFYYSDTSLPAQWISAEQGLIPACYVLPVLTRTPALQRF